jgi:hypothetical protein
MAVVNNSNNGLTFLRVYSGSVLLTTYLNELVITGSGAGVTIGDFNNLTLDFSGGGGSTNTGSLLTTASFSDPNLTFTKGNGSTFSVNLSTLTVINAQTASYIDGGTF